MITIRKHGFPAVSFVVIALVLSIGTTSTARKKRSPEEYFAGEIIMSKKPFPDSFKSDAEFIRHMIKVDTKFFHEKDDKWEIHYMAFLIKPITATQCILSVYDITEKSKERRVSTYNFYPSKKEQQIMASHLTLSNELFQPNRKYLVQFSVSYGSEPLAESEFVLY